MKHLRSHRMHTYHTLSANTNLVKEVHRSLGQHGCSSPHVYKMCVSVCSTTITSAIMNHSSNRRKKKYQEHSTIAFPFQHCFALRGTGIFYQRKYHTHLIAISYDKTIICIDIRSWLAVFRHNLYEVHARQRIAPQRFSSIT